MPQSYEIMKNSQVTIILLEYKINWSDCKIFLEA